jgi:transposase InsO family protein
MSDITPKDHAEAVAVFRSHVIGPLICQVLGRGAFRVELHRLSKQRFRPPNANATRTFSVPTLERWYYRFRHGGLAALEPQPRSDRGRARALSAEQRGRLRANRREDPAASAEHIVRPRDADGRLAARAVSPPTVRRLYRDHGLDRLSLRSAAGEVPRLRWQAESPNALWHGDVCHGPAITVGGVSRPLRIHGLLDDCSRYVPALEAHHTERECDMLDVFSGAIRREGPPAALYLDNGSTYRGDTLKTVCARLGTTLLHAQPYDPQARGKMERFWRTLRAGCLDFLGPVASLAEVNARLRVWLEQHYHAAPHAGLMGRSPLTVWTERQRALDLDENKLREAFTLREPRRVRKDSTVAVDGIDWELDQGFLAGRVVTVGRCVLDVPPAPWIEHEGKRLALHPVDPTRNARRKRKPPPGPKAPSNTAFDPMLGAAVTVPENHR